MPNTSSVLALPYPAASAAPDVPGDIYALANKLDSLAPTGTISYSSGWAARSGYVTEVRRNPTGLVSLVFAMAKSSAAIATNDIAATLPTGYRPANPVVFAAAFYSDSVNGFAATTAPVFVAANGSLQILAFPTSPTNVNNILGAVTYTAAA